MRQLTTLHDAPQANRFADYLRALNIETRLDVTPAGVLVWIFDEDRLPQARTELQSFLANPDDVRFRVSPPKVRPLPIEEVAETEEEPTAEAEASAHVPVFSFRLTALLILVSTIATVLANAADPQGAIVRDELTITTPSATDGFLKPGLPEVCHGQVWRLVTPIFLHFGIWHLVFNMLWLHQLGKQIEQRSGALFLAGLILVVALVSNLGQYYFPELRLEDGHLHIPPTAPFGGMSGVVFGLFGYVWLKSYFQPDSGLYIAPNSVILMLGWFVLCTTGLMGPIANTAHGVGLVAGMTAGYLGAWWNGWGTEET